MGGSLGVGVGAGGDGLGLSGVGVYIGMHARDDGLWLSGWIG